jgi:hypothetical protein
MSAFTFHSLCSRRRHLDRVFIVKVCDGSKYPDYRVECFQQEDTYRIGLGCETLRDKAKTEELEEFFATGVPFRGTRCAANFY